MGADAVFSCFTREVTRRHPELFSGSIHPYRAKPLAPALEERKKPASLFLAGFSRIASPRSDLRSAFKTVPSQEKGRRRCVGMRAGSLRHAALISHRRGLRWPPLPHSEARDGKTACARSDLSSDELNAFRGGQGAQPSVARSFVMVGMTTNRLGSPNESGQTTGRTSSGLLPVGGPPDEGVSDDERAIRARCNRRGRCDP